jgi:hypothetical protein
LERRCLRLTRGDLPNKKDYWKPILMSNMQSDAGIGRTRPPSHEANTNLTSQARISGGHHGRSTFVPSRYEPHILAVVE